MEHVKCRMCGWTGSTAELEPIAIPFYYADGSFVLDECEVCPNCEDAGWLTVMDEDE